MLSLNTIVKKLSTKYSTLNVIPLVPALQKNDRRAAWLIISFSIIVFGIVAALGRLPHLQVAPGFDVHIFAAANAVINTTVSILLLTALWLVKQRRYKAHRNTM